jgi:hypothetical protein
MESRWILCIEDLEFNLLIDRESIGTFIGISDRTKMCWKLAIYLGLCDLFYFLIEYFSFKFQTFKGNEKICILFEKGRGIIEEKFLENVILLSKTNLAPKHLLEIKSPGILNYINTFVDQNDLEFFIFKLNLFRSPKEARIRIFDFLEILKANLVQIEILEEGDVISKFIL